MPSSEFNLRPVWKALLETYKEVEKFCKLHNLRFYAAYGTALGAVRHKGFIPWDDDLDIAMPRNDYMRFLRLAETNLPKHLKVDSIYNNPNNHLMFAKVVDTRMEIVDKIRKETGLDMKQGLFIDIFPLDGHPKSTIGFFLWAVRRAYARRHMSPLQLDAWFQRNSYDDSPCANWLLENFSILRKRMVSPDTFGSGIEVPFCDTTIRIPSRVKDHLTSQYGDYMTLPPKSQRKPSHQSQ